MIDDTTRKQDELAPDGQPFGWRGAYWAPRPQPKPDNFAAWLAQNPEPDIADLIRQHGSYGAIPAEAKSTSTKCDDEIPFK